MEFVYNYQSDYRVPDGLNSILPIFPGAGGVVGSDVILGQRGIKFSGVTAPRSVLTSSLTSEVRFGLSGGSTLFRDNLAPAMFDRWRGYAPSFGYATNPYITSTTSRRNSPVKQLNVNLSWLKSRHLINFGGSFTNVHTWQLETGSQVIPGIAFGVAANDPVNFGPPLCSPPISSPTALPRNATMRAISTPC